MSTEYAYTRISKNRHIHSQWALYVRQWSEAKPTCDPFHELQHPHDHSNTPWSTQACVLNHIGSYFLRSALYLHTSILTQNNWTDPWLPENVFSFSSPSLWFAVCVQASPRRCEGGGGLEEVLGAEEAPRGAVLHSQEPVQTTGGVSIFSPCTSLWYDLQRLCDTL